LLSHDLDRQDVGVGYRACLPFERLEALEHPRGHRVELSFHGGAVHLVQGPLQLREERLDGGTSPAMLAGGRLRGALTQLLSSSVRMAVTA